MLKGANVLQRVAFYAFIYTLYFSDIPSIKQFDKLLITECTSTALVTVDVIEARQAIGVWKLADYPARGLRSR
jgi:hypothetical protein